MSGESDILAEIVLEMQREREEERQEERAARAALETKIDALGEQVRSMGDLQSKFDALASELRGVTVKVAGGKSAGRAFTVTVRERDDRERISEADIAMRVMQ